MTKEAMFEDKDSIMWKMNEEDGKVSARTAFNAMRAGDKAGKEVVDKYIKVSCLRNHKHNKHLPA